MSKFHLRTRGALEVNNPHTLEIGADGTTYQVAGRIDSLRDPRPDVPSKRHSMLPCWHGQVQFDSVRVIGDVATLDGHYVDEGTKFRFILRLDNAGNILTGSNFERVDISSSEVIEAQENWQHYKGLSGRNDPSDRLVHSCWRDRIWDVTVTGSYVDNKLTAEVFGDYRLV
jgi:hypothetical protein